MNVRAIISLPAANAVESRSPLPRLRAPTPAADESDKVLLSETAKALLSDAGTTLGEQDVQSRLDAIKSKPAVQRTSAETDFVNSNDTRLKEIQAKSRRGGLESLMSDELDYMQKAGGFVSLMANLSPHERALYDDLTASGQKDAAHGLRLIALARTDMNGQQVTLPNGRTFDPTNTALTGESVRELYRFMIVDPSGASDRAFSALATALDQRKQP